MHSEVKTSQKSYTKYQHHRAKIGSKIVQENSTKIIKTCKSNKN